MTGRSLLAILLTTALAGCAGPTTPTSSAAPISSATPTPSAPQTTTAPQGTPASQAPSAEPTQPTGSPAAVTLSAREYPVPAGSHPHDVAPAADGGVWYTAQQRGALGHLDPTTGATREIPLGSGSSPHGVIIDKKGDPWVTDSGLNAIVKVDATSGELQKFDLPPGTPNVNLNTAAFDGQGILWFTGQAGFVGSVDPGIGIVTVLPAPKGRGPYGIAATPAGDVWFVSLAGSYLASIDAEAGAVVVEPPTKDQGARRVWSDSAGRLWIAEWDAGQLGRYDPASADWREWKLPGDRPQAYAIYVDERDIVWLTDFGADAIVRFDPTTERFESVGLPANSTVRQLLGRPGELWGAESALDRLVVVTEG